MFAITISLLAIIILKSPEMENEALEAVYTHNGNIFKNISKHFILIFTCTSAVYYQYFSLLVSDYIANEDL